MRFVSNVLFWGASFSLIVGVVFLEIGTRYMRKGRDSKRKKADRIGLRFLLASGIMYALSYLFAIL